MGKINRLEFRERLIVTNHGMGNVPKAIVIHETDHQSPAAGALQRSVYFGTPGVGQSCHYLVDDLDIIRLLSHDKAAWHLDPSLGLYHNGNTIGIEICVSGQYFSAWYRASLLTAALLDELGLDVVIRHQDASGIPCPKGMLAEPLLWERFLANVQGARGRWKLHECYRHYDPHKDPLVRAPRVGIVLARHLDVHSGGGPGHKIIGTLPQGAAVTLGWLKDGWWSVEHGQGMGYIISKWIEEVRRI